MIIKHTIPITIRGSMPDNVSAKSFSAEVADQFIKSDKVEASTHFSKVDKYALQWQRKHTGVHYENLQSCF